MLQIVLFELSAGLLKGGDIDVEVEFSAVVVHVPHRIGQNRKQCINVLMRLPLPRDTGTSIVVTQIVKPRRRVLVNAAMDAETTEDTVCPIIGEPSIRP